MVVSVDLITDAPLHHIADLFRKNDAAVTALFYEPFKGTTPDQTKKPKDENGLTPYCP